MLRRFGVIMTLIVLFIGNPGRAKTLQPEKPRTISFDQDWRFIKADPVGAESPGFDDSGWRTLNLPHDWSIEDLPDQADDSVIGPFSRNAVSKMGTGYTVGGTAWYRKTFTIPKHDKDKKAYLQFDGIYMNADIWVNGKHTGNHAYGYTSFWFDITTFLNVAGQPNIVAVQVKNEGLNARWYSGSGIYRHTWLTLVNPVHVAPWGLSVTTPEVSEKKANVEIVTNVINTTKENMPVHYWIKVVDPSGNEVGNSSTQSVVLAGKSIELKGVVSVVNPRLWSIEKPGLYYAEVQLVVNNKVEDKVNTSFGIRSITIDAKTGLMLNGKNIELKGGCFHHDNGPLGAAAIDRAEERKIEILKKAGFNAIRTSHNPPSPYLLDACDRLGMLVINEVFDMWEKSKMDFMVTLLGEKGTKYDVTDYSKAFKTAWQTDVQSTLMRDRNHPSIIMWSIGNEIMEAADTSGLRIAKNLVNEVRKYDKIRAVTEGLVDMGPMLGGKSTWEERSPHIALLDVAGYNYGFQRYQEDHQKYPERVMYASEFMPSLSLQNWQAAEALPYVIGNFTWSAMDYIGEAGVGTPRLLDVKPEGTASNPMAEMMVFFNFNSWPMFVNFQGDVDLIGNPKTASYYQHVVWRDHKISMFVHRPIPPGKKEIVSPFGFPDELKSWNWPGHEGEKMQVHVYTRSKLVKLELNGKLIGEQAIDDTKSITATFEAPYEPGILTARCFDDGIETSSETIKTLGKPFGIKLSPDRSQIKANRNDLSYVMVEVVDSDGNVLPYVDDIVVNFEISGKGEIAGVGNGSPTDMSSFKQPRKKTWQGKCLVIVRPKGSANKIVLTAKAEGLKEASTIITTK